MHCLNEVVFDLHFILTALELPEVIADFHLGYLHLKSCVNPPLMSGNNSCLFDSHRTKNKDVLSGNHQSPRVILVLDQRS